MRWWVLALALVACDTRVDLGRPKPTPSAPHWVPITTLPALDRPVTVSEPDRSIGMDVTLIWTTPGDPDPDDTGITGAGESVGADLDLHVVRPGASDGPDVDHDGVVDGWFDALFDVYFLAPEHFWGAPGAGDDPRFWTDDTDGGGPEEVLIAKPEAGLCYQIGVHAWDDWGFGRSDAIVRVSYDGVLVFESPPVALERGDLWDVARVCWSDGAPRMLGCDDSACVPRVMQGYPVPLRVRPL